MVLPVWEILDPPLSVLRKQVADTMRRLFSASAFYFNYSRLRQVSLEVSVTALRTEDDSS